jgi:hypothetical protein
VTCGQTGKMLFILVWPSWKGVAGGALMSGKSKLLQVQARLMLSDCSVPVSKLPQLVYETKKDLQQSGLVSIVIGHVGDG